MRQFIRAMIWRETRTSWKRLLLFVLSIAAGVGGLVAVKSFSYGLEDTIRAEARSLLAADLVLQSHRPLSGQETAALERLKREGATLTPLIQFNTMGITPATNQVHLIQVRAVGSHYPFYGEVITLSGKPFRELLSRNTVLVHSALLSQFMVRVGDTIRVGSETFTIAGELISEPDRPVQILGLGPGLMMTEEAVMATGLVSTTSHVHYRTLVRLPPHLDPPQVANQLKAELPDRNATVRTFDESQPTVQRFLTRLGYFLNLVGLAALLLGGIGVAGAIRVMLGQKLNTLAILKCLGATSRDLLIVYLSNALLMGLMGSLIGAGIGLAVQGVVTELLRDFLPVSMTLGFPWRAIGEGIGLGLFITLWFALPPLLSVRRVPPAAVFRRQVEAPPSLRERLRSNPMGIVLTSAMVAGLVIWQVGPGTIAWIALGGLGGTFLALNLGAWGLLTLLRRLPRPRSFILNQGLASLYRPGNQTSAVVVSMGLGVLLVLAVFLIQSDLLRQVAEGAPENQPNLFFIDIQKSQQESFQAILNGERIAPAELIPLIRGRLRALNGKPLLLDEIENKELRRIHGFEFSLTYRDRPIPGETIVKGVFDALPESNGAGQPARVSVAEWWLSATGLNLGDRITFNIQGVSIEATITSVRRVNWANRRANFSFVFLPGALEDAPQSFVAALSVPDKETRLRLRREVTERHSNISVIDAEVVFQIVQQIMNRIALVIQFMAIFSVMVGLVILMGTIATTRFQRIRESVLYKTLGATRRQTAGILVVEYLFLGGLAGLIGSAAAGALSWGLAEVVFEVNWQPHPLPYLITWGVTTSLIAMAGLAGSLDVLMKKPLQVLREE